MGEMEFIQGSEELTVPIGVCNNPIVFYAGRQTPSPYA